MLAGCVEKMVPAPLTDHRSKQATNLLLAAHIFQKLSPYLVRTFMLMAGRLPKG